MTVRILLSLAQLLIMIIPFHCAQSQSEVWFIDNTDKIANYSTQRLGDPKTIETPQGLAVEFDGIDDALIVDANPLAGMNEFTVEVIFKPANAPLPQNAEQRFIHIQESDNRRILIELRVTNDYHWFLDTFIKNNTSSKALYAEAFPHPIGEWYHAALVYSNGTMSHYVNGVQEMTGDVQYEAMHSGQTAIGVRLNRVSWYNGTIHKLKVTNRALTESEFMSLSTGVDSHEHVPQDWKLCQNNPNPFNAETTISYRIIQPSLVKLNVFNLSGQMVTQLADEYQTADEYHIDFNGLNLASGMYLYRLQVGASSISKKMLLLR